MKLIKDKTSTNFLGRTSRAIAAAVTIGLVVISVLSLTTRGLQLGLDFTGGVLLEITYPRPVDLESLRAIMEEAGYEDAQVQRYGTDTDVPLRLPPQRTSDASALGDTVRAMLSTEEPHAEILRMESVGPQVGDDLREQGGTAVIIALGMIFVYLP